MNKKFAAIVVLLAAGPVALAAKPPPMDCVIEPAEVVDLSSAVNGVVRQILVDRGDAVEEGQVLVRLDSGVEDAALQYAKARAAADAQMQAEKANADFTGRRKDRLDSLYRQKLLASDQMDEAATDAKLKQLQYQQAVEARRLAELDARQAEEVAKRHVIRSPIRGVVVQRYLSPGESVEHKGIMRLAQIDPLRAEVIIPVAYFGSIRAGQQAVVVPEAPKDTPYPAVVAVVDRVADAASGTFRARLTLPNRDYSLPSGLRCTVQFLEAGEKVAGPPAPAPRPAGMTATTGLTGKAAPLAAPAGALSRGSISRTLPAGSAQPADRTSSAAPTPATTPAALPAKSPAMQAAAVPAPVSVARAAAAPTPAAAAATVARAPRVCQTLGPLDDAKRATAVRDALASHASAIAVRAETPANSAAGYMVLSAAQESTAAAEDVLRKMESEGITELAVVKSGPYAKRVSAGIYKARSAADRRRDLLNAQGVAFEIVAREHPASKYWLDVQAPGDADSQRRLSAALGAISPKVPSVPGTCDANVVAARD